MTPFRRLQQLGLHRYSESLANSVSITLSCIVCAGVIMQLSPASASQQQQQRSDAAAKHQEGRRPPEFGSTVPTITMRGVSTAKRSKPKISSSDNRNREDCPMCKKFSSGPCGQQFTKWLACTDANPGNDDRGEPLHLTKCSDFAEKLADCLDENLAYYSKSDDDVDDDNYGPLTQAWTEFVRELEAAIQSGKYSLLPFPHNIQPKMEVRPSTLTGAAFFVPENDGQPILAAYILDDSLNVIAAASREDMCIMNNHLGCVIQFKIMGGMKSATCRAVYNALEEDDVVIYTRSMLVPEI